jgi:hypothetical protein
MDIKVIAFYEIERTETFLTGTLHMRFALGGEEIDLRGLYIVRKKSFFHINMPSKVDGEIRYPTFAFAKADKQKAFLAELRRLAIEYIERLEGGALQPTADTKPKDNTASAAVVEPAPQAAAPAQPKQPANGFDVASSHRSSSPAADRAPQRQQPRPSLQGCGLIPQSGQHPGRLPLPSEEDS